MPLHKDHLNKGFRLPQCEKHFHDHDETWLILKGKGSGYWIDHDGQRQEFVLEAGDVWMVPAGYEHGSVGPNSEDFTIAVFNGTEPPGAHKPGHYYVEKEGYIPSFELKKAPTERYRKRTALPARMKGILFVEQGKTALQEEDTPTVQRGKLLCQTLFSGLTNGTERNVLCGGNYGGRKWPNRCGYQNVGRVLEAGPGVAGFSPGDLIFSGDFGQHRQYFAAPAGAESLIVKVPPEVEAKHAALFGMASVAMHDVRRTEVKLGERVLVVGAGPIGQFTAQAARIAGAHVTVCDLNERRLKIAAELGAQKTIAVSREDTAWEAVKKAGPFDVVFEDSGGPVLDWVIGGDGGKGILRHRARVVMIAGRDRVEYGFNPAQGYELCVYHAGHFAADDLHQVCRLAAEGALAIGPIIQDVVPIERAPDIYDRLRDDPGSLFGTVLDWQEFTGR
jgi:2-desacetyl-2-hydroxyethyl bacteriochlorophyllide A dehydrogenase